ncbi:hypothetical protein C8R45DRAFT_212204 [Mycena sanguinolenta]|nr:hypothetical protein C8R45DRAFT_212204 [Mycena sanguinolenta]
MPPARVSETRKNTSELGAELCNILDLRKRLAIFNNIEKEIHKLVDQHFDLTVPSSKQPENMQAFVQQMVDYFPGHFSTTKNNVKDRIAILEVYTASYIDENLLESQDNIDKPSSEFRAKIIIAKRPPPRPPYSHKKQKKNAPIFQTQIVTPLLPALPIESDPPPYSPTDVSGEDDHDDSDSDDCPVVPGGRRRTCFVVPSPPPSRSPSPAPIPVDIDLDVDVDPIDIELDVDVDAITEFCDNCCPSMRDRADALRRTGATQKSDLIGMARWQDEDLRNFLRNNQVAQSALEEQALLIGFQSVLMDSLRPASSMSL